jgi:hypothetical protein
MADRSSVACVIRIEDEYRDGGSHVWYVGPFMPHVGSATTRAASDLGDEDNIPAKVLRRQIDIETLFLAPGESDLGGFK